MKATYTLTAKQLEQLLLHTIDNYEDIKRQGKLVGNRVKFEAVRQSVDALDTHETGAAQLAFETEARAA